MESECTKNILDRLSMEAALQIIPQLDRIIFKLHCYGLSPTEIAMVVDRDENYIDSRITETMNTLNEFADYL